MSDLCKPSVCSMLQGTIPWYLDNYLSKWSVQSSTNAVEVNLVWLSFMMGKWLDSASCQLINQWIHMSIYSKSYLLFYTYDNAADMC